MFAPPSNPAAKTAMTATAETRPPAAAMMPADEDESAGLVQLLNASGRIGW